MILVPKVKLSELWIGNRLFLQQNPGMDLKDEMEMFAKHEKR